ncbi:LysM peptidoglycan-binding domain-containing protein [Paucilactobacillus vaccinostercus]|nr:LysM domain-containing protein [Paucilactobacillus vaccinostercus]
MNFKSKAIKFLVATLGAATMGILGVTATANADSIYTVQSGDTLSSISYKFANNTSMVNTLATKNNISDINFILVGQKLYISDSGQITQATKQEVATTPAATQGTTTTASQSSTTQKAATTTTSASTSTATSSTAASGSDASAKAWIAARESGGSYTARNGQYVGKYQLSSSYLNGDYSAANQERVANNYVSSRYVSWSAAKAHWQSQGWY